MEEAKNNLQDFTYEELSTLRTNLKNSKNYTDAMYKELMQGIIVNKYGLNLVDDAMRDSFELGEKAAYKFDVYNLDKEGKRIGDKSKMTVFTNKDGNIIQVRHTVGEKTGLDRKKVNGYTNADTKPYERGHIFSFQEGLADNCIEDSPLNIIPQSKYVNSPRMSQFEAYRSRDCKSLEVITDIDVPDYPGYVRVRVPDAGIDVTYNPLSETAKRWKDDWYLRPKSVWD